MGTWQGVSGRKEVKGSKRKWVERLKKRVKKDVEIEGKDWTSASSKYL